MDEEEKKEAVKKAREELEARKEKKGKKEKSGMPLLDHIEELRWRLIKSILSVAVMGGISFAFAEYIYKFITIPLGDVQLHFTEITGSFYAYLKISFITGVFAALPIVLYQVWKFVAPGLYRTEKRAALPMTMFSTILFLMGAAFCFFVVLPFALNFLINYGGGEMTPIITVSSYISFAGLLLIAFGVAFQLPVVGYFLGSIGLVTPRLLGKGRPYAVIAFLIGAAILSPPDIFTQVLLAGPLYILYEITIIIVKLTGQERVKKEEKEEKEVESETEKIEDMSDYPDDPDNPDDTETKKG